MESGGRLPSNHRQNGAQSNAHNFFFLHGVRCIMWATWFSFPISPLISDCLALLDTNHDLRGNRWVTSRDGREKMLGSFTLVKSYTTKFTPLFRECRQILFLFLWYSTIFSFPPFSSMMMEHLHRHTGRKSLPIHPHADLNFAKDINRTASLLHATITMISATKTIPMEFLLNIWVASSHAKKQKATSRILFLKQKTNNNSSTFRNSAATWFVFSEKEVKKAHHGNRWTFQVCPKPSCCFF